MHPIQCLIMQSPIICKKTEKGQKVPKKDTGASQSWQLFCVLDHEAAILIKCIYFYEK